MYELDEFQRDALKELGSLGSGKASAELSKLADTKVKLEVPFVDLVLTENVPNLVGGPKQLVVGAYAPVTGDVSGTIVVVFPVKSAKLLVDLLNKDAPGTCKVLKVEDRDKLKEVGSILCDAYLNTLTEFLEIKATHESPRIVSAFGESLPDFVLLNIRGDHALLLKTVFDIPSTEELEGNFVLLLTAESIEKVLETITAKL